MRDLHERLRLKLPQSWRSRVTVVAVIAISYCALFYGLAHMRAPPSPRADSRPMFAPIISNSGEHRAGIRESNSRASGEQALLAEQEQLTPPARHWNFPPIDLSPSAPDWVATVSELTPVTDAVADPSEVQSPSASDQADHKPVPKRSVLRMVRWFRPVYASDQCASVRVGDPLVLDLRIDPSGRPVEITAAQSSGSPQLDRMALHAAALWRFAPPMWKSQPVEVWGRLELRFNC